MSSTIENESKAKINSVASDDLWVSCDSTSHPGLKFYVNKLTGIKVWNITDSEIAFAENADKNSQEPVRGPNMDNTSDARKYNEQIINNQVPNQLPNWFLNSVPVYSPFSRWDDPNSAQPAYTLVPTALAEVYHQLLPLANSLQNGNLPISYNAQHNQPTTTRTPDCQNKWLKNRNRYLQNQSPQNQFSHPYQGPDLRKRILARRRSLSTTFSENEQEGYNNKESRPWNDKTRRVSAAFSENEQEGYNNKESKPWNDKTRRVSAAFSKNEQEGYNNKESRPWNDKTRRDEREWREKSIQINLEPLKLLTSSGSESERWYIVVDTDVILNNFNYLNNMATADPDCHLLIPHHVMLELRSHASESNNVQARRIFRFLNEQIQCGLAMLGEEEAGEDPVKMTIMTCVKLSTQNNHVILISNNTEILKYKSKTKYIHVFTLQDIKNILANKSTSFFRVDSPTLAVKITVPNDVSAQNFENTCDLYDTTFRNNYDSNGHSDDRMSRNLESGVRLPEYFDPENTQNPIPVSEEYFPHTTIPPPHTTIPPPHTAGASNTLRAHSRDNFRATFSRSSPKPTIMLKNFARDDDGTKNLSRAHFVDNVKNACNRNSTEPRITYPDDANTDVTRKLSRGQSVENVKNICSRSPPIPRIRHQSHASTDVVARKMSCVEEVKNASSRSPPKPRITYPDHANIDVVTKKMPRAHSVENVKNICGRSPLKTRMSQPDHANTDVDGRNMLARFIEHNKTVCSQSSPKARITHPDHTNTDVGDRNMLARSMEHITTVCSQSSSNLGNTIPHKELVTRTHYEENFIAYSPQSARDSDGYINTMASNKNALGVSTENLEVDHNQSPSKFINRSGYHSRLNRINQSPLKADDVSLCSSSATSGHVSLDTIRMKRIISMKRLISGENKQAKSITSNTSKMSIKSQEIMQQVNIDTSASRSSYDNDSVTNRTSNIAPNITVDETSLSAISNSESSHSEKAKNSIKKDVKKVCLRNAVMFNVGCQSMEEVLKTRCDEWVFRFVQIMEEVLRVKLQEKLPFDNKEYPALRDLQEAARSIIKKYSNNFSVVEAANKLSFILYKTSDEDGQIAVNIQPADYMEMYSYGVFLVDTFQDMSADCQVKDCKKEGLIKPVENQSDSCSCYEVKTASESLKKLLYDIQNANLETFVDHPRDLSADSTIPDTDQYDFEFDAIEQTKEPEDTECHDQQSPIQQVDRSEQVENIYNLRSQKRKSQCFEDEEVPPKVPMSGKGKLSFFNCLRLKRAMVCPNKIEGNSHVKDMNINKQNVGNPKGYHTAESKTSNKLQKGDFNNLQIHFGKDDFTKAKLQSKVVCNFTVNPDIERKVKARQNEAEYEDYSENEEITKTSETSAANKEIECVKNNGESNKKFTCFMGRLVQRLGELFSRVKLLCDEYVNINEFTDVTTSKELRNKMEKAYSLMGLLHDLLSSISNRDLQNNGKNIQKLLEIAKVKDCIPDEKLCQEYRYMINKCKETSKEFHNNIQKLLNMVCV